MTTPGGVPAGWYDDGSGQWRWFDGTAWTEHVHVPAAADPAPQSATTDAVATSAAGAVRLTPEEAVREALRVYRPPAQTYAPLPPEELDAPHSPVYARPAFLVGVLIVLVAAAGLTFR